jgi:hypothetical protein
MYYVQSIMDLRMSAPSHLAECFDAVLSRIGATVSDGSTKGTLHARLVWLERCRPPRGDPSP